ncbi:unnamed protein product [Polarella glacialis]|uniref:Uncharacterized protein n=1 Tax=Polarella glacialis TaxID=89957 RepID=A0A813JX07_POLGL|nr:unnamed protein product [Polarella glacialis]
MASAHHHELASYSQFMHPTDETSVWLAIGSFEIIRTTPAFTMVSGPSPEGRNLLDWIRDSEDFEEFIQDWMQMMPSREEFEETLQPSDKDSDTPVVRADAGSQCFRPPSSRASGVEYVATCEVEYRLETPEAPVMKMILSDVRPRRKHACRRADRHKSRRPSSQGSSRSRSNSGERDQEQCSL